MNQNQTVRFLKSPQTHNFLTLVLPVAVCVSALVKNSFVCLLGRVLLAPSSQCPLMLRGLVSLIIWTAGLWHEQLSAPLAKCEAVYEKRGLGASFCVATGQKSLRWWCSMQCGTGKLYLHKYLHHKIHPGKQHCRGCNHKQTDKHTVKQKHPY